MPVPIPAQQILRWHDVRAANLPSAFKLVCFAVPLEAKPFLEFAQGRNDLRVLLTGIGMRNAERAIREVMKCQRPARVFTCGFAGALNPQLKIGDLVTNLEVPLPGTQRVIFTCAARVAITAAEKSALRAHTGADAVEMESAVIENVCRESRVPCVTLRVISDTAGENLPLDFNALMTGEHEISSSKLALAILKSPRSIPALVRLGRNSAFAAGRLATVLAGTTSIVQ